MRRRRRSGPCGSAFLALAILALACRAGPADAAAGEAAFCVADGAVRLGCPPRQFLAVADASFGAGLGGDDCAGKGKCAVSASEAKEIKDRVSALCDGQNGCGADMRELVPSRDSCSKASAGLMVSYACSTTPPLSSNGNSAKVVSMCADGDGGKYQGALECGALKIVVDRATLFRTPAVAAATRCGAKDGDSDESDGDEGDSDDSDDDSDAGDDDSDAEKGDSGDSDADSEDSGDSDAEKGDSGEEDSDADETEDKSGDDSDGDDDGADSADGDEEKEGDGEDGDEEDEDARRMRRLRVRRGRRPRLRSRGKNPRRVRQLIRRDKDADLACSLAKTDRNAQAGVVKLCMSKPSCKIFATAEKLLGGKPAPKCATGPPILRIWYHCEAGTVGAEDDDKVVAGSQEAKEQARAVGTVRGKVTSAKIASDGTATIEGWACLSASSNNVPIWAVPPRVAVNEQSAISVTKAKISARPPSIRPPKPDEDLEFVRQMCGSSTVDPFFTLRLDEDFVGTKASVELSVVAFDPSVSVPDAIAAKRFILLPTVQGGPVVTAKAATVDPPIGDAKISLADDGSITVVGYACIPGVDSPALTVNLVTSAGPEGKDSTVFRKLQAKGAIDEQFGRTRCAGERGFVGQVKAQDNLDGLYLAAFAVDPDAKRAADALLGARIQIVLPIDQDSQPEASDAAQLAPQSWEVLFKSRGLLSAFKPTDGMVPQRATAGPVLVPKLGRGSFRAQNGFFRSSTQAVQSQTETSSTVQSKMVVSGFQGADVKASARYMMVTVSAQFGFKQEQSSFSESVATRKGKVLVLSLPKVQISIDPSFFVVNPAFVDAVKAFLAKVRRPVPAKPRTPPPTKAELDAFLEVVARWGILFPRTVVMGAKLYNTEDSTTENSEQGQDRSRTINAGAGVDVSFGRIAASFSAAYSQGTSSSAQNSWLKEAQKSGFSVVGGDETLYDGGDLAAWRQSVNPWSKWQVIEVQDVQPVDTLLPDDLAKAVHPFVDGLVARTQKMVDDINEALMRSVAEQQVKAKAAKDRAEKEAADKYAADLAPRKLLRSAVVKAAKDKRGRITFDCPQNLGKINIVSAQYCPSRPGKPPPRKKGAPPPPPPPPPGPPVSGPPNPCTDQCQPKDVTSLLRNYCKQPPMGSNIKDMQRTYGYLSDSDEHSCAHTAFNKAMDEVYGDPCKGDKSLFVTYTCDRE